MKTITLNFAILLLKINHIERIIRMITSLILVLLISHIIFAQNGGQTIFQVLNLAPSARSLALGGKYMSVLDSDIVLAQFNPALASPACVKQVSLSQSFYYSGSSNSGLGIGYYLDKQQITISGGLQYLQHGDIQATDEFGNKTGTFRSGELALIAGASKKIFDPLTIGINLKYITSHIETYNSSGLGIDLGALYTLRNGFKSIGLTVRNIGTQWSPYQEEKELLPLDVLIGFTQRLEHVPFILTVTAHSLNNW
ncbi:MAG: type IX secretion system protein PorQ, partial [Saprospiraceae bacterium]